MYIWLNASIRMYFDTMVFMLPFSLFILFAIILMSIWLEEKRQKMSTNRIWWPWNVHVFPLNLGRSKNYQKHCKLTWSVHKYWDLSPPDNDWLELFGVYSMLLICRFWGKYIHLLMSRRSQGIFKNAIWNVSKQINQTCHWFWSIMYKSNFK